MSTRNPADPESTDIGLVHEHDEPTKHAARLTVCRNATSTADAAELLAMLGLTDPPAPPSPRGRAENCIACGHPMHPTSAPPDQREGRRRHCGHGRCSTCYNAWQRSPDYKPSGRKRRAR